MMGYVMLSETTGTTNAPRYNSFVLRNRSPRQQEPCAADWLCEAKEVLCSGHAHQNTVVQNDRALSVCDGDINVFFNQVPMGSPRQSSGLRDEYAIQKGPNIAFRGALYNKPSLLMEILKELATVSQ